MDANSVAELRASLAKVPYQARWELLKPTIKRLYIDEGRRVTDVAEIIKTDYEFSALWIQILHQQKMEVAKKYSSVQKSAILAALQTRESTKAEPVVKYKGETVNPKKLRRHLKLVSRRDATVKAMTRMSAYESGISQYTISPLVHEIILSWNVPHGLFRRLEASGPQPVFPAETNPSNMSDIEMLSCSDRDAASLSNSTSKLAVALSQKKAVERAHLFLQGKFPDLLNSMNAEEKRTMSMWLYQYWGFGYRTAKGWGRTSQNWAAGLLRFDNDRDSRFSPVLCSTDGTTKQHGELASFDDCRSGATPNSELLTPPPLRYWTIHKAFDGPEYSVVDEAPKFRRKLREALESSDFSTLKPTSLPMALPQVLKAAEMLPNEFFKEAFGFAIMGRDEDLVQSTCDELLNQDLNVDGLFPYHLATSYLDGSRTCCNIFNMLVSCISEWSLGVEDGFTNNLGHTVLDNLMITILRSHTSLKPSEIDDTWDQETRFVGQEVDICGRWDADSECVRRLYARGRTTIPFSWKHKFCHTSAQPIFHCINIIGHFSATFLGFWTQSGLFLKHCPGCGLKLQLYPLHTLVLVAFHLAQHGCEGEDLFGILACLLCVLRYGANPLRTAHISLSALRIDDDSSRCDHVELDPVSLAEKLESLFSSTWSKEVSTGWQIICFVLYSSVDEWTYIRERLLEDREENRIKSDSLELTENALDIDSDWDDAYVDMDDIENVACEYLGCLHENYFGENRVLRVLWAAVQTELLTYRRREEGDPWTSDNFNMQDLLLSLNTRGEVGVKLVQDNMMKPYCKCGTFTEGNRLCTSAEDTCAFCFSNMEDEDCGRMTYIDMPDSGMYQVAHFEALSERGPIGPHIGKRAQ